MDYQLTLLLIVVGAIVVGFIYFDAKRRSKVRRDRVERELYEARVDKARDAAGYDHTGVGEVRVVGGSNESELSENGLDKPEASMVEPTFSEPEVTAQDKTEPTFEAESSLAQELEAVPSDDEFEQAKQEAWQALNELPENELPSTDDRVEFSAENSMESAVENSVGNAVESTVSLAEEELIIPEEASVSEDDGIERIDEQEPIFAMDEVPVLDDALFEYSDQPLAEPEIKPSTQNEPKPRSPLKRKAKQPVNSPQQSLFADDGLDSVEPEDDVVAKEPELIISLYILANADELFQGEPLVRCLLDNGMSHGDLGIFHRHSNITGRGTIQFSLANAFAPGTIELDKLDTLETRGLAMFLALPGPKEPIKAYELMVSTAQNIVSTLGGQILDASKSSFNKQIAEHHKEQINEYQHQQLLNSRK